MLEVQVERVLYPQNEIKYNYEIVISWAIELTVKNFQFFTELGIFNEFRDEKSW